MSLLALKPLLIVVAIVVRVFCVTCQKNKFNKWNQIEFLMSNCCWQLDFRLLLFFSLDQKD